MFSDCSALIREGWLSLVTYLYSASTLSLSWRILSFIERILRLCRLVLFSFCLADWIVPDAASESTKLIISLTGLLHRISACCFGRLVYAGRGFEIALIRANCESVSFVFDLLFWMLCSSLVSSCRVLEL